VENEKTARFGHVDMPVFGAGKDLAPKTWQSVYRQLLAAGLVSVDHAAYGALRLEPEARAVFQREREVLFRKDRPTSGKAARQASASSARAKSALEGADLELFEALRATRLDIARDLAVPPYMVFPDTTLVAFATERPTDEEDMLGVSGVGQSKLERFGDAFLSVIIAHSR
jgi:ATP-dependent DNA helicase RecQ